jgi:uncharacterized protein with PIN domain
MDQVKNAHIASETQEKAEPRLTIEIPTEIQAGNVCQCTQCCNIYWDGSISLDHLLAITGSS